MTRMPFRARTLQILIFAAWCAAFAAIAQRLSTAAATRRKLNRSLAAALSHRSSENHVPRRRIDSARSDSFRRCAERFPALHQSVRRHAIRHHRQPGRRAERRDDAAATTRACWKPAATTGTPQTEQIARPRAGACARAAESLAGARSSRHDSRTHRKRPGDRRSGLGGKSARLSSRIQHTRNQNHRCRRRMAGATARRNSPRAGHDES